MKKTGCVLISVFVVLTSLDAVFAEDEVKLGLSADFLSKYIWRGQNLNDESVFQPSASVSAYGFTGSVWGSHDLTNENDNAGEFTEVDYTLDYTNTLPGIDGVNWSVGVIHYRFPNTSFEPTTEIYGGLTFIELPLTPAVRVYRDVDEVEGSYYQFALGHTFEKVVVWTEDCSCDLALGASVGYGDSSYNRGYFGADGGGFNDLTLWAGLPICFPDGWTFKPSINYSMMLSDDIRTATVNSDNIWGGVSLSKTF